MLAVRVGFWGAVAALAFVLLGGTRWLLSCSRSPPAAIDSTEPVVGADPGWPHRRGPSYNAISSETDLADSWPPEGPTVLWTRELGRGYSALIVAGGRVYTQTQSLTAQSVVCLDAETGTPIWQYRYGWPYEAGGSYPGPRATPTYCDGWVYFAAPDGLVGCLSADDGGLLWSVNVNEEFGGRGTDFGYACSPLVVDGKVILPVGGQDAAVVALDTRDGSTEWASGSDAASYCSAVPITFRGRRCVVALLQNSLTVFDLASGRLLWREKLSGGYDEHAAAPLYEEPLLMIACPFQSGAVCYRLDVAEPEPTEDEAESVTGGEEAGGSDLPAITGELVWHSREMSNDTASSVLVDGCVYGFDLRDVQVKVHRPSRGTFKCLDLASGNVRWSTDRVGHATVIAADGKLILFNDRGELLLARASPDGYEELARAEVFGGEICWTAPTLHRGRLYLRSPTRAACVYVGRPEDLDPETLEAARPSSEIPKLWRPDLTWLVGGERPYAMDPADLGELARWYGFSLVGVLGLAALVGGVAWPVRLWRPHAARRVYWVVFWSAALLGGVAGTAVYNRLSGQFVFTWPVCLFVAHQLALMAIVWANREAEDRGRRRVSLLAVVFFLGVCLVYYLVCRRLGLAIEWIFLLGFIPSWPLAVPAASRLVGEGHRLWRLLWVVVSFSVYFWAAGGLFLWKAAAMQ